VGAPVHFVANVGLAQPLPASGAGIELTFDRLLMPACITRQTFVLTTESGAGLTPTVTYDPVSRIVTVTPDAPLTVGQTYTLTVLPRQPGVAYTQPVDTVIGVMAIDGATLDLTQSAADGGQPNVFAFQATQPVTSVNAGALVDCPGSDVAKIFAGSCGGASCHNPPPGSMPAQGLVLTDPAGVLATAIGQVAVGANTGARPAAESPNVIFGLDMPIVDPGPGGGQVPMPGVTTPGGDPGNSWLMYKLLMAVPSPGDAGSIVPLSATERATLASLVPGREMPYPGVPGTSLSALGLTIDQLETISQWIAAGAQTQLSCPAP
jgi:hypothetical protein